MENKQHADIPEPTPEQLRFLRLLHKALGEGFILADSLQTHMERMNLSAENMEEVREFLVSRNVRLLPAVEDPTYTPDYRQEILQLLEQEEESLSERERLVLTMRLKENKTLEDVARHMGSTRERIRQIERKAIRLISRRRHSETHSKKIRDFYR